MKVLSTCPPDEKVLKGLVGALADLKPKVVTAAGQGLARFLEGGASKKGPPHDSDKIARCGLQCNFVRIVR